MSYPGHHTPRHHPGLSRWSGGQWATGSRWAWPADHRSGPGEPAGFGGLDLCRTTGRCRRLEERKKGAGRLLIPRVISVLQLITIQALTLRHESVGKEDDEHDVSLKPFIGTLRVTKPVR